MLNSWTIQQLAKMEHEKNLKKAEVFHRLQQSGLTQKRSHRTISACLYNFGKLLVTCGLFLQKRYSTATK